MCADAVVISASFLFEAAQNGRGRRGGHLEHRAVHELRDDTEAPGLQEHSVSVIGVFFSWVVFAVALSYRSA